MYICIFLVEIFIIFIFSRILTGEISYLFHRISKNKKATIYLLAFIFLPGTIIHELSHFLMAKLLFIQTGKISFLPKIEGSEIKLGTITIAKTDPIRRFLIGIAPLIFGTVIILITLYFTFHNPPANNIWIFIIITYILFEICNTMFSSKKDLQGSGRLLFILIITVTILYIMGIRISFDRYFISSYLNNLFTKTSILLLPPLFINGLLILLLKIL
jgi:hypothetical protein